jgi:hypothetical protein
MATPTSLPATFVAGNILTAAQMNDLRGAFRILQVVSTTKTDTFSASVALGASTDITGLSVSITPTSASSKIYIVGVVHFANVNTYGSGAVTLVRDSTAIGVGTSTGSRTAVTGASIVFSGGTYDMLNTMISHLDSPATTSATTYKLQLTNATRAGVTSTMYVNRNNDDADLNRTPRPVSTITAFEVSA